MCVCVCAYENVPQEHLSAPGTPSKTSNEGEKRTWKWDGGAETTCVWRTGVDVSGWTCYCNPSTRRTDRCVKGLQEPTSTFRAQTAVFQWYLVIMSLLVTLYFQGSSSVAVIMSAGYMSIKLEAMCWCILLVAAVILSAFYNLFSRDVRFSYYCSATGRVGCCYSNVIFTVSPGTLINDSDSLTLTKYRTFNSMLI